MKKKQKKTHTWGDNCIGSFFKAPRLLSSSTAGAGKHTNSLSVQSCSTVLHPRPKTNTNYIKQDHIPVVEPSVYSLPVTALPFPSRWAATASL